MWRSEDNETMLALEAFKPNSFREGETVRVSDSGMVGKIVGMLPRGRMVAYGARKMKEALGFKVQVHLNVRAPPRPFISWFVLVQPRSKNESPYLLCPRPDMLTKVRSDDAVA